MKLASILRHDTILESDWSQGHMKYISEVKLKAGPFLLPSNHHLSLPNPNPDAQDSDIMADVLHLPKNLWNARGKRGGSPIPLTHLTQNIPLPRMDTSTLVWEMTCTCYMHVNQTNNNQEPCYSSMAFASLYFPFPLSS